MATNMHGYSTSDWRTVGTSGLSDYGICSSLRIWEQGVWANFQKEWEEYLASYHCTQTSSGRKGQEREIVKGNKNIVFSNHLYAKKIQLRALYDLSVLSPCISNFSHHTQD